MWPNPQIPVDLVTLTEDIFDEKLHFLCSSKRDKWDVEKYTPVPVCLEKLSDVVNNIVRKTVHDKLVLLMLLDLLKTDYDGKINEIKGKYLILLL